MKLPRRPAPPYRALPEQYREWQRRDDPVTDAQQDILEVLRRLFQNKRWLGVRARFIKDKGRDPLSTAQWEQLAVAFDAMETLGFPRTACAVRSRGFRFNPGMPDWPKVKVGATEVDEEFRTSDRRADPEAAFEFAQDVACVVVPISTLVDLLVKAQERAR